MTLLELVTITESDLPTIAHNPDWTLRWHVYIPRCEVKDGVVLASITGRGKTLKAALQDYAKQLRGKRIVFNAYSGSLRREYVVPHTLTGAFKAS